MLRHLEDAGLPAVRALGLAARSERGDAILVTEYLRHSMQYRRLLMRFRQVSPAYRDRLLDAMALLLVDLHRGGVYWGDCSLANTLFRRDGDRSRPTSWTPRRPRSTRRSPTASAGSTSTSSSRTSPSASRISPRTRAATDDIDAAIGAAESVRARYEAVWGELYDQPELIPGDRQAIRTRLRRLNDLGFSVDLDVDPVGPAGSVRIRTSVTTRRYHANELERRTKLRTLEGQARILLNDLAEYHAWLEFYERRAVPPEEAADRWLREVYRPTLAQITGLVGPDRDLVQAYCDVLEHKWLLSELEQRDVGLRAAIESYVAEGAPAPERTDAGLDSVARLARRGGRRPGLGGRRHELAAPAGGSGAGLSPPSARGGATSSCDRRPPAFGGAVSTDGSAG